MHIHVHICIRFNVPDLLRGTSANQTVSLMFDAVSGPPNQQHTPHLTVCIYRPGITMIADVLQCTARMLNVYTYSMGHYPLTMKAFLVKLLGKHVSTWCVTVVFAGML